MIIAKWNPTLNKYDYIGGLTEIVKKYVGDVAATKVGVNDFASATAAGIVSTGSQAFAGTKEFQMLKIGENYYLQGVGVTDLADDTRHGTLMLQLTPGTPGEELSEVRLGNPLIPLRFFGMDITFGSATFSSDGNFSGTAANAEALGGKSASQIMLLGMSYADREKIVMGNLDDYKSAGKYVVPDDAAATQITNSAFTNMGYFLDVIYRTKTQTIQIAMNWAGVIKIRYSVEDGTYYDWRLINDGGNAKAINGKSSDDFVSEEYNQIRINGGATLCAAAAGYHAISLNWAAVEGAEGYYIQQVIDGVWTKITGNLTEMHTAITADILPDTEYKFRLVALTSPNTISEPVTVKTPKLVNFACAAPSFRPLFSGSAEASLADIPSGAWYGQY